MNFGLQLYIRLFLFLRLRPALLSLIPSPPHAHRTNRLEVIGPYLYLDSRSYYVLFDSSYSSSLTIHYILKVSPNAIYLILIVHLGHTSVSYHISWSRLVSSQSLSCLVVSRMGPFLAVRCM